jgi:HEXXH motif-containing protein
MTPDLARSYSGPLEPFPEPLHRSWAGTVLSGRIGAFLSRWEPVLTGSSEGVGRALWTLAAELRSPEPAIMDEALETAWHPFAGVVPLVRADVDAGPAALARLAQLLLRLAARRAVEGWVRIGTPVRLGFEGYRLPPCEEIELDCSGSLLTLRLDRGGEPLVFRRRDDGRWHSRAGAVVHAGPEVSIAGRRIAVYPLARSYLQKDPKVVLPPTDGVAKLREAARLIESLPSFATWVARTVRMAIPLRRSRHRYDSESFAALPGAVFISLHPDSIRTAETLVHESCHDHLHLLLALDPLADASGEESFFSPPRASMRPTLGILKAYHAFANVLCFYYLLEAAGRPMEGSYGRGIGNLEAWNDHFVQCLDKARTVTAMGEALWRPLARRVDQLREVAHLVRRAA